MLKKARILDDLSPIVRTQQNYCYSLLLMSLVFKAMHFCRYKGKNGSVILPNPLSRGWGGGGGGLDVDNLGYKAGGASNGGMGCCAANWGCGVDKNEGVAQIKMSEGVA